MVYQDNQSAMILDRYGHWSKSKWKGHINIQFFFIKDWVASKEAKVEYCPTHDVISDLFAKTRDSWIKNNT